MKNFKKSYIMLLALLLLFLVGGVPNQIKAAERDFTINDYGTITGYNGSGGDVVITPYVNGIKVVAVGTNAFRQNSKVTSITIPEGVTSIGYEAFYGCINLTSIIIPKSMLSIDNFAFEKCTSLTSITIPKGVTSIGNCAFRGCTSLTSITIPEGITSIKTSTFNGCTKLTSVTLPESLTAVSGGAFQNCSNLNTISIPNKVTSIEGDTFYECTNLTSVTIPEGVTSIGVSAFEGCVNLPSIKLPKSVTSIGNSAFYRCPKLESVYFYNKDTKINNNVPFCGQYNTYVTIYGKKNSTAELHAKTWYYKFQEIGSSPEVGTSKLKVVLEPKEELQLSVEEDLIENAKMTWTSSDSTVATVDDNGLVTAIKSGNTIITTKNDDGTFEESIYILVVEDAKNYRLAIDLKIGQSSKVTIDDATFTKPVTWSVMDSTIATISNKGSVTAVSDGLTIATATDEQGNAVGQIYIRVRK